MKSTARATSLPARHPLAQGIALALALSTSTTQAAVFNVTTNADGGLGSLRQAVLDANANPGADQITFEDGLGTIVLTSGQIDITETLTITGPAAGQTIDAGGNSRILAVTVTDQPLTLENLTVKGGRIHNGDGGGIFSRSDITLTNSTISGNSQNGSGALGGGGGLAVLSGGDVTLTNSIVSGNSTAGDEANGGGVFMGGGTATLTNSTVSGNSTTGLNSHGGGFAVFFGTATATNSIISDNSTTGEDASGGGIALQGGTFGSVQLTLTNSTVSGNSTAGNRADGGGIFLSSGSATLTNSTVSGNSTLGMTSDGGAMWLRNSNANLTNSTFTANGSVVGTGGIELVNALAAFIFTVNLDSTILAANSGPGGNLYSSDNVTLNASNSLFGDDPAEINGVNIDNVFIDAPGLAPLADNGCAVPAGALATAACVQTHALLPSSPALNAGSNPLNLAFDQRGAYFPRVLGEAADIGAFEFGECPVLHMTDYVVSTTETHDECQIRAGPNMTVTSTGNLTLKGEVRIGIDREVRIEKGGRLRIQIE